MKVALAYDILYDYLTEDRKSPDISFLLKFLEQQRVDVFVEKSSMLLLYEKGLLSSPAQKPIKYAKVLPIPLGEDWDSEFKLFFFNEAIKIKDNAIIQFKKTDKKELTLIKLMSELNCIRLLKNREIDYVITNSISPFRPLAYRFSINTRIADIDSYLEYGRYYFPEIQNPIYSIRKSSFSNIDVTQKFFDSYREEYHNFNDWFSKGSDQGRFAYIVEEERQIYAFLSMKVETEDDLYYDFNPLFLPKKRLKICSFKVKIGASRISERFLSIIFESAILNKVDEIYITMFPKYENRRRLQNLLENYWGFSYWGEKNNGEIILVRRFDKFDEGQYRKCYPFHKRVDTSLAIKFNAKEMKPLSDGFIRHSLILNRNLNIQRGNLLFILNPENKVTYYGIVEDYISEFIDEEDFVERCKNRTAYTKEELLEIYNLNTHVSVVKYLSFRIISDKDREILTKRINSIINGGSIENYLFNTEMTNSIIKGTEYENNIVVD